MAHADESRPAVLTVEQVAGVLGVSRNSAYAAVKTGDIPSIRVGRRLLVPRHGLEELLGGPLPEQPPAAGGAA